MKLRERRYDEMIQHGARPVVPFLPPASLYIDVEVVIMTTLNRKNETSAQTPAMKRDFDGLSRLHDEVDQMFNNFFAPSFFEREPFQMKSDFLPSLDVTSDDKAYAMKVELPGVAPEAVKLEVNDGVLTISGEKKEETKDEQTKEVRECSYGSFSRSMTLPEDADAEHITATSKNGILTVSIPRKAPDQSRVRKIEVRAA